MTKGVPSLRAGVSVFKFSLYFALKFKKSQKIQNFPKIVQKKAKERKIFKKILQIFCLIYQNLPKFAKNLQI